MAALKLSILTNMVAPYREPFFKALAADRRVTSLRVLTCTTREVDREWKVSTADGYIAKVLGGFTLNLKRGSDGMRILHFRVGIFWELLRHRPDSLVIGDASWTSFLAVAACKILRIRYLVWSEITTSSNVSEGTVAQLRRWMYRGADHLIASCQMAKDFLLHNRVSAARISIVLNAVDSDFFLAQRTRWEPERPKIRRELGVEEDAFCFIFVGQLIARKRVLETVELLANVSRERPVHLLVAGSGPLEREMRRIAADSGFPSITFCGFAQPERLSQLYVASDAVILLSEDEPWGMVVSEAVVFGKKFIATNAVAAAVELKKIMPSQGFLLDFDVDINSFKSIFIEFIDCEVDGSDLAKGPGLTPEFMCASFMNGF